MEKRLFTSESVTEGHPDKMCHIRRHIGCSYGEGSDEQSGL